MKLFKNERFLSQEQLRKVFLAVSILWILLYVTAAVFSLCGNEYFILKYQNSQMDAIENFMRENQIMGFVTCVFLTLEFSIVMSFILQHIVKIWYPLVFYSLAIVIAFIFPKYTSIIFYFYPFLFYIVVPLIDQLIENKKINKKEYLFQMVRFIIAVIITVMLQALIMAIKAGYFDGENHVLILSSYFIYTIEYDIALLVMLFTASLYINREKGDSISWAKFQDHGGSSQTLKTKSQKSLQMKNLSKTQRNKLRFLYFKIYLIQLGTFLLVMILPFLTGKVFEFLVMYLTFIVVRYILGFKYSLHFKKESLCALVGVIVFGILTLAVPFFYVLVCIAIVLGSALALLLHLSYKYNGLFLFNQAAKPDKFAELYVIFDGDLDLLRIHRFCRMKGLDDIQTRIVEEYIQGNKISYIAKVIGYSPKSIERILNESIDKLSE